MPSYTAAVSIETSQELDCLDLSMLEREITAALEYLGLISVNVDLDEDVTDGLRMSESSASNVADRRPA